MEPREQLQLDFGLTLDATPISNTDEPAATNNAVISTATFLAYEKEFAEKGYQLLPPVLKPGKRLDMMTSLKVVHSCGYARNNSVSLQKARKRNFELCPKCWDHAEDRKFFYTWDELAEEAKRRINARLIMPKDDIVYARTVTAPSIKNEIEVQCNITECGHKRTISIKTLFKPKGNGCPGCAGNITLDPATVIARAQEYGLRIVNPHDYRGATTELEFECVTCKHTFKQTWMNQRKRSCKVCRNNGRYFGEMLLHALCSHYFPEIRWVQQYKVLELVPNQPETPLFYDIASPELRIAIENHSEYHLADSYAFNGADITSTLEKRKLYDQLKKEAIDQKRPPMGGWAYGEVWFELKDIKEYAAEDGSYIPRAVHEFAALMKRCGQDISEKPVPSAADLFAHFSTYISFPSEAEAHGFSMLNMEWQGRAVAYPLQHLCGHVSNVIPNELEANWEKGKTGCAWCDGEGRLGEWKNFIELVGTRGWRIQNPTQLKNEIELVEFICDRHPEYDVQTARRSNLREECREGARNLPTCPGCRQDIQRESQKVRADAKVNDTLVKFNALLCQHGQELVDWDWKGTSIRGGGEHTYTVKCQHCQKMRQVRVNSYTQKLKQRKRPSRGCPDCERLW